MRLAMRPTVAPSASTSHHFRPWSASARVLLWVMFMGGPAVSRDAEGAFLEEGRPPVKGRRRPPGLLLGLLLGLHLDRLGGHGVLDGDLGALGQVAGDLGLGG